MSKRSAQGGGSIRQRPDGKWEARYTIGRDPGTGKQVQKSVYGATQAEVRKKLQQATTQIDSGTYLEPSKMTVAQWLDLWLVEYTGGLKVNTAVSYETQIRMHIKPALGAVKLEKLTTPAVQSFYNDLQRKKGLSAKTVKNIHGVLTRALGQAVAVGYARYNPCQNTQLPRIEKKKITPLEGDAITNFLDAILGQPLETLFRTALLTGMRQSELMGLTWDCVDFESGTILVDKQLIKEKKIDGVYRFAEPKNSNARRIAPAPSVMRMLRGLKSKQAEQQLRAGQMWLNTRNLVFTNEIGQHYAHNTLSRSFKRIAKKIGLENNCFHDLRHSYAVLSLQNGDDIKTLQENLGHATVAFTLDVYGHVSDKMRQDSANRMEAFIKGIGGL